MRGNNLLIPILGLFAAAAHGQTSPLYMVNWQQSKTYVLQGGTLINSFDTGIYETALAVSGEVRTMGGDPGYKGSEYTLGGAVVSPGVYPNPGINGTWDGTTDGLTANYTIGHSDLASNFSVFKFDRDWANGSVLFTPEKRSSGITYDQTDNSFWVTETEGQGTAVSHYDAAGTLLGSFPIDIPGAYGIALDPADDTLWITETYKVMRVHQYSKAGALLQQVTIDLDFGGLFSAEFAIPAPGWTGAVGAAALLLGRGRRRVG